MKSFKKDGKRFKSINKTNVSSLRGVQLSDLAVPRQTRYLLRAPAKSGAGISLLIDFIDDTKARLRFFLCRAFCYISMVGRAGALQSAPVSMRPVRLTPSGSTTRRLASPVVVINTAHRRMPYGYYPHPDTPVTFRSL